MIPSLIRQNRVCGDAVRILHEPGFGSGEQGRTFVAWSIKEVSGKFVWSLQSSWISVHRLHLYWTGAICEMVSATLPVPCLRIKQNPVLTPAKNAKAIDHGGVRVRAHYAVRVHETLTLLHCTRQVLQINLMYRADVWRNHADVLERFRTPLWGKPGEKSRQNPHRSTTGTDIALETSPAAQTELTLKNWSRSLFLMSSSSWFLRAVSGLRTRRNKKIGVSVWISIAQDHTDALAQP